MKPAPKKRADTDASDDFPDEGFSEEEKAAIRMLQPEVRKMLAELE